MFETLRRERATESAKWEMSMKLIGVCLGVKADILSSTLSDMKRHLDRCLDGRAYSAAFVRDALEKKRDALDKERKMFERLSQLGNLGS